MLICMCMSRPCVCQLFVALLQRQKISRASKSYLQVSKIILADFDDGSKGFSIDLLIGCDLYRKFMTGKVIRRFEGYPVALTSVLGWVLSSPVSENSHEFTR